MDSGLGNGNEGFGSSDGEQCLEGKSSRNFWQTVVGAEQRSWVTYKCNVVRFQERELVASVHMQ